MVALVGIPGSGKTSSGNILCDFLNKAYRNDGGDGDANANADANADGDEYNTPSSSCCSVVLPMDGYHYSLEELRSFANADDAIYRRGAPDTFDVVALKRDLQKIRYGGCDVGNTTTTIVRISGFDHAVGDPVPDLHTFDRNRHNIVIMEGLYLLHQDDHWENVHAYFDETIYLDNVDLDTCLERLKERNLCLPGYTPQEIVARVDKVDRKNAILVQNTKDRADTTVVSSGGNEYGGVCVSSLT